MRRVTCSVDGASRGNPGTAGCGFVIESGGVRLAGKGVSLGETTNNVAEYFGLIFGLVECLKLGAREVIVRSDSQLLIRQMRGQYRVKDAWLKRLHATAAAVAGLFENVVYECVPREQNRDADRLAGEAAGTGALFDK